MLRGLRVALVDFFALVQNNEKPVLVEPSVEDFRAWFAPKPENPARVASSEGDAEALTAFSQTLCDMDGARCNL